MKQKQTQEHREQTIVAKGESGGGGMEWEVRVSKWKLLHMEWINNKVLLYSTESYIQYPVITIMEKNIYIFIVRVCMSESCSVVSDSL